MSIEIIDILKPKNGLSFKLVDAIDIAVSGYSSLADAVSHFATTAMIEAINTALSGKADAADLTALAAVVDTKADDSDLTTATANLQAQIDAIITPATQDAEVQNARIAGDGTTYTTLKERIDTEFSTVEKDIDNLEKISFVGNSLDWADLCASEQRPTGWRTGYLADNGGYSNVNYAIRTSKAIRFTYDKIAFQVPATLKIWAINEYSSSTINDTNFVKVISGKTSAGERVEITVDKTKYYAFSVWGDVTDDFSEDVEDKEFIDTIIIEGLTSKIQKVADDLGALAIEVAKNKVDISNLDHAIYDYNNIDIGDLVDSTSYPLGWKLGKLLSTGAYINQPDGMMLVKAIDLSQYDELTLSIPSGYILNYIIEYTSSTISDAYFSKVVFNSDSATTATFSPENGKYYAFCITGVLDFSELYDDSDFVAEITLIHKESKIDYPQITNEKISFVEFDNENGVYITQAGTIQDAGSNKYNVATASVTAGDTVKITASTSYTNPYYAFFDANMNVVKFGPLCDSESSTVKSIRNYTDIVPNGASLLCVAWNPNGEYARIKKVSGEKVKGSLLGKKWCCIGDSLTDSNKYTSIRYFDYVSELTDITTVEMGVSGSGYARMQEQDQAFYQRTSDIPLDSDVITIFGSFNDLGAGLDLGTATDTGTTTLAGCINTTIDNIQTRIPLANIGIVAPTPWKTTKPNISGTAYEYVEMMKSICELRSIPFLDLWRASNLRPWDADFREIAFSKDGESGIGGTHPNEIGHKLIAARFKSFIESLII